MRQKHALIGISQYNGNIASQSWGTSAAPNAKSYTYTYDPINRLTSGVSTDNYKESGITYDANGNILTLQRTANNTLIDNLSYTYNSTNQVKSIVDNAADNTTQGYRPGTYSGYQYDANGNMTVLPTPPDGTALANINISYNLHNLPQTITGGRTITYTYDAAGQKLRRVSPNTGSTDYIAGIQYDQSSGATSPSLSFIQTEEGKAVPASGGTYDYYYYLGDNLGNTRVTFDTNTGSAQMLQQDDYYPFGLEINRARVSPKNEYLYNKKELQEELGQYDYGARFFDPVIGRFNTIDPLAEKNRRFSTYTYGANNPIRFIDVDGMVPGDFYDSSAKHIGSDGIDDKKKYVVFDPNEVKTITNNTKKGQQTCAEDVTSKATINGGCATVEGVIASVNAEENDTSPGAGDAGLHEEGGDRQTDKNGNDQTVLWQPGSKKSVTGKGTIDMFNGMCPDDIPMPGQLKDSWHVHTSKMQEVPQDDGTTTTYRGSMGPSGCTGDTGQASSMQDAGYNSTFIQVGTSQGIKVNFFDGTGVRGTMTFRAFKKLLDN